MWVSLKDSGEVEGRAIPVDGFSSNTETKRNIKGAFVMVNTDGNRKMLHIVGMKECSTTKKVLKCGHDSESGVSYDVDVSSSIGKTGDIPYPSDEFALYKAWMTNSFVQVEEDGSITVKKIIGFSGDQESGISMVTCQKMEWDGKEPIQGTIKMGIIEFLRKCNPVTIYSLGDDEDDTSGWKQTLAPPHPLPYVFQFAKPAVDLMWKANPTMAENMEEFLKQFAEAFSSNDEDASRIGELCEKHMASADAEDQDGVNCHAAGVMAYILAHTFSIATPGLRRASKRASTTEFDIQGQWLEQLREILLNEYADGDDDRMGVVGSNEAAMSDVPASMDEAIGLFQRMLANTVMAKDASLALKTTVPEEADSLFEMKTAEAFNELIAIDSDEYECAYERAQGAGKVRNFGSFVMYFIRHRMNRDAEVEKPRDKRKKGLFDDKEKDEDEAEKDLSMSLTTAKSGGGATFRTIQFLAKAPQADIQEWIDDTPKFASLVESLRKLLAADCEIENQAKLVSKKVDVELVENLRLITDEKTEAIVDMFSVGLGTMPKEKARSLVTSFQKGSIFNSVGGNWVAMLGAEEPNKGSSGKSVEVKNAWTRVRTIAYDTFKMCYGPKVADAIFRELDIRIRRLSDETKGQPRPGTMVKWMANTLGPAVSRECDKWQKSASEEADTKLLDAVVNILKETAEAYVQMVQNDTSEEAAAHAVKISGKGKGNPNNSGKGAWDGKGKGKGTWDDGSGKGKGKGSKGGKGKGGKGSPAGSGKGGKGSGAPNANAFNAIRGGIDDIVNKGKDFRTESATMICTHEVINGSCARASCPKIHGKDYGARAPEVEAAKKEVKTKLAKEWKEAGGK